MASNVPTIHKGFPALYPGTTQVKAYTGTHGEIDNAVAAVIVRVVVSTAAYIKFGVTPTATTSDVYLAANTPEYFRINAGEKVSAVQVASGGNLFVTEMD